MGGGATIGLSVINCENGANGWFRISGKNTFKFVVEFVFFH
tara:strand:- start:276 stop:398 length:123 start_codon:yes stop_codon:yes gene_type:complete